MLIYILIPKIILLQILISKNILRVIFSARKKDIANLPKEYFRPTLAYCKFKV